MHTYICLVAPFLQGCHVCLSVWRKSLYQQIAVSAWFIYSYNRKWIMLTGLLISPDLIECMYIGGASSRCLDASPTMHRCRCLAHNLVNSFRFIMPGVLFSVCQYFSHVFFCQHTLRWPCGWLERVLTSLSVASIHYTSEVLVQR